MDDRERLPPHPVGISGQIVSAYQGRSSRESTWEIHFHESGNHCPTSPILIGYQSDYFAKDGISRGVLVNPKRTGEVLKRMLPRRCDRPVAAGATPGHGRIVASRPAIAFRIHSWPSDVRQGLAAIEGWSTGAERSDAERTAMGSSQPRRSPPSRLLPRNELRRSIEIGAAAAVSPGTTPAPGRVWCQHVAKAAERRPSSASSRDHRALPPGACAAPAAARLLG